jgi:predicted RNA-binding protein
VISVPVHIKSHGELIMQHDVPLQHFLDLPPREGLSVGDANITVEWISHTSSADLLVGFAPQVSGTGVKGSDVIDNQRKAAGKSNRIRRFSQMLYISRTRRAR